MKKERICLNCKSPILRSKGQRGLKYCNNTCQSDHRYKVYIVDWKNGLEDGVTGGLSISRHIRRYLFEKFDNKCCKCSWSEVNIYSGNTPLEVDHKDGDYTNNKEENLDLLCPNCHSLTPTFRGLNTNGRKNRK